MILILFFVPLVRILECLEFLETREANPSLLCLKINTGILFFIHYFDFVCISEPIRFATYRIAQ